HCPYPEPRRGGQSVVGHCSAYVQPQQVFFGFPSHQDAGVLLADRDHGGPGHVVVVAGHGVAVGAGGGHCYQVAGTQVGREVEVAHDDVAALAVLADQAGQHRLGVAVPRGQHTGVLRTVQRGADVVAHTAVDTDIGADPLHVLDCADLD